MEIKKKSNTFDVYLGEFSYGELLAMRDALAKSHTGPIADDMYQGLVWHLEKLPKPGEDEEKDDDTPDGANNSLRSAADDLKTPDESGAPDGPPDGPPNKKQVASLKDLDDELPAPPAD